MPAVIEPVGDAQSFWSGEQGTIEVHVKCRFPKKLRAQYVDSTFCLIIFDAVVLAEIGLKFEELVQRKTWHNWIVARSEQFMDGTHWQQRCIPIDPRRLQYKAKSSEGAVDLVVTTNRGHIVACLQWQVWKLPPWEAVLLSDSQTCADSLNGLQAQLCGIPCEDEEAARVLETLPEIMSGTREKVIGASAGSGVSAAFSHFVECAFSGKVVPDDQADPLRRTVSGFPLLPGITDMMPDGSDEKSANSKFRDQVQGIFGDMSASLERIAHQLDVTFTRRAWFPMSIGLANVDANDNFKLHITNHNLQPGDEFALRTSNGLEFNRVLGLGSIHTLFPVYPSDVGIEISKIFIGTAFPALKASDGKTFAFIKYVENFDASTDEEDLRRCVRDHARAELETDPGLRAEQLINLYTRCGLYPKVNAAMYKDRARELKMFAPYIRALRDQFRKRPGPQLLAPFEGRVSRKVNFYSDDQKRDFWEEYFTKAGKGLEVCFSSFTSTTASGLRGNSSFGGAGEFIIHLAQTKQTADGSYFPASIKEWSAFPNENEVLVPPHCKFRILNIKRDDDDPYRPEVHLTLSDQACVWDSIEQQRWDVFEAWARAHPEFMDTGEYEYSIINSVAAAIKEPMELAHGDPLSLCIALKANVNEIDKQTGATPLGHIVETHKELAQAADGGTGFEDLIRLLLWSGANPNVVLQEGETLEEKFPGIDVGVAMAVETTWMYWVDDMVDGKADGWYEFPHSAIRIVEDAFVRWLQLGRQGGQELLRSVSSGFFTYDFDFDAMRQTNTTSGKVRIIRRCVR